MKRLTGDAREGIGGRRHPVLREEARAREFLTGTLTLVRGLPEADTAITSRCAHDERMLREEASPVVTLWGFGWPRAETGPNEACACRAAPPERAPTGRTPEEAPDGKR